MSLIGLIPTDVSLNTAIVISAVAWCREPGADFPVSLR